MNVIPAFITKSIISKNKVKLDILCSDNINNKILNQI